MGQRDDETFLSAGDTILDAVRQATGLPSAARVVDVGCAYGRFAHALLRDPEFHGRYLGFDVLRRHVHWCRRHLTPWAAANGRWPFRFRHLDVHNERYNPGGRLAASEARFPVDDAAADVVIVTSVFTHMWDRDIVHYLDEIVRVMDRAGRAFVTFFLVNADVERLTAEGVAEAQLVRLNDHTWCRHPGNPLHVIAYDEAWVLERLAEAGLALTQPINYGSWCGRTTPNWQDELVVRRRNAWLARRA